MIMCFVTSILTTPIKDLTGIINKLYNFDLSYEENHKTNKYLNC